MHASEIIAALAMQPHPEGGWYAETFRDNPQDGPMGGRGHSTAIYYLLERGQISAWHRVKDAAEVWHYYAGGPIALSQRNDGAKEVMTARLGPDILSGERPQIVVPANVWQTAEPLGEWTLVGCTVAPGFDFAAFELEGGD